METKDIVKCVGDILTLLNAPKQQTTGEAPTHIRVYGINGNNVPDFYGGSSIGSYVFVREKALPEVFRVSGRFKDNLVTFTCKQGDGGEMCSHRTAYFSYTVSGVCQEPHSLELIKTPQGRTFLVFDHNRYAFEIIFESPFANSFDV
jgi:hypothetical protein